MTQTSTPAPRLTSPPHAPATDAAGAGVAAGVPLANALAAQVIESGEIVQLIIKPSRWFILLNSLRFSAIAIMAIVALHLLQLSWMILTNSTVIQLMILAVLSRMAWSFMQWMGRYYIVTDRRIIRLSGVFTPYVQSCPLRKVSTVKSYRTVGERLVGKGSLEIVGQCEPPMMLWQTITRHRDIYEKVMAAVSKSQQNGNGG